MSKGHFTAKCEFIQLSSFINFAMDAAFIAAFLTTLFFQAE
jgi:hypothetical protein